MDLNPILRNFSRLFAEIYPTENEARMIVDTAGIQTGYIDFTGSSDVRWSTILNQARLRGRLEQLIETASDGYEKYEPLQQVLQEFEQWQTQETDHTVNDSPPVKSRKDGDSKHAHGTSTKNEAMGEIKRIEIGSIQAGMVFQGGKPTFSGDLDFDLHFGKPSNREISLSNDEKPVDVGHVIDQISQNISELPNLKQLDKNELYQLATLFRQRLQGVSPDETAIVVKVFRPLKMLVEELGTDAPDPEVIERYHNNFTKVAEQLAKVSPEISDITTKITERIVSLTKY